MKTAWVPERRPPLWVQPMQFVPSTLPHLPAPTSAAWLSPQNFSHPSHSSYWFCYSEEPGTAHKGIGVPIQSPLKRDFPGANRGLDSHLLLIQCFCYCCFYVSNCFILTKIWNCWLLVINHEVLAIFCEKSQWIPWTQLTNHFFQESFLENPPSISPHLHHLFFHVPIAALAQTSLMLHLACSFINYLISIIFSHQFEQLSGWN